MKQYDFWITPEIEEMIASSESREKSEHILSFVSNRCKEENISFSDYQWQSLSNHLCAMVNRSITGELLTEIDTALFEEISEASISLALEVVRQLETLEEKEKYLLSVHFEVAKQNDG